MPAPVPKEADLSGLKVTGRLPNELTGRYVSNGPNLRPDTVSPHWFTGAAWCTAFA